MDPSSPSSCLYELEGDSLLLSPVIFSIGIAFLVGISSMLSDWVLVIWLGRGRIGTMGGDFLGSPSVLEGLLEGMDFSEDFYY